MELVGHFLSLPMAGDCHMCLLGVKCPLAVAKKPPAALALPECFNWFQKLNIYSLLFDSIYRTHYSFSFVKYGGTLHVFPEIKEGKTPPPMILLQNKQPKIFLLRQSSYLGWRGWSCVSGSCVQQKVQPCPDQWQWLLSRVGLFETLPCSSCSPVSWPWGLKIMSCLHLESPS